MTATATPDAADIVALLGGQIRMRHKVRTLLDLVEEARAGLPKQSLTAVAVAATRTPAEAVRVRRQIIPDATWKRRAGRLRPAESDRTLRLARLVALAQYVWHENAADAAEFMATPHPMLQGQTPLACSDSDLGAEMIEAVLLRLLFGIAS